MLFIAEIDDLLLGKRRVVLNLVNGRNYLSVRQQLLEVTLAVLSRIAVSFSGAHLSANFQGNPYVRDANCLRFAGLHELLHQCPAINMVVVPDDISRAVGKLREFIVVS